MRTCTRRLHWDAMHRVPGHSGACRAFHGHRYAAEITCAAPQLDDAGFVIDFGVIKQLVGAWISHHWDHTAILAEDDPEAEAIVLANARLGRPAYLMAAAPTAENLVVELARVSRALLREHGVQVVAVRLWETPNGSARWTAGPD